MSDLCGMRIISQFLKVYILIQRQKGVVWHWDLAQEPESGAAGKTPEPLRSGAGVTSSGLRGQLWHQEEGALGRGELLQKD